MNLKKTLMLCFFLITTQSLLAQEKDTKFSHRFSTKDSTILQPAKIKTYHKVFETLKGLNFIETVKTVNEIKEVFKPVKANDEIKNKEDVWDTRKKALSRILGKNPASLLSLFWPLFLIFFVFWFLKQYKKVFIAKIKF